MTVLNGIAMALVKMLLSPAVVPLGLALTVGLAGPGGVVDVRGLPSALVARPGDDVATRVIEVYADDLARSSTSVGWELPDPQGAEGQFTPADVPETEDTAGSAAGGSGQGPGD